MRHLRLLFLGALLFAGACGERAAQDPAPPPAAEPAAEPAATAAPARPEVDEAFLAHMHAHAEKLDELNFALDDDNLEAAQSPAYWLSRHEMVRGIPADWQAYMTGMREAAEAVETAADLAAARAAADRISDNCQACHTAAGITGQ